MRSVRVLLFGVVVLPLLACGGRGTGLNSNAELCGNAELDTGESCDSSNLGGRTCEDEGFSGGTLVCASDCTFDTSSCDSPDGCGDGVLDPGEDCDGGNLGGADCESQGWGGGVLVCSAACRYDLSGCSTLPVCGNGDVELGEACDDGNTDDGDGCSSTCQQEPDEEGDCTNGIDDDQDGQTDCDDGDCVGLVCGDYGRLCIGGECVCPGGVSLETACDDGVDEDCDGLTDCDDPDCATELICTGSNLCQPSVSVSCGDSFVRTSPALGDPSLVSGYSCAWFSGNGDPEQIYRFDALTSGSVTFTAYTGMTFLEIAIVALGTTSTGVCDPIGTCIDAVGYSFWPILTINVVAGETYYFVLEIDASNGAYDYDVEVACN